MSTPDLTNTSPPLAHRQISPQPQGTTPFEPISELSDRSSVASPTGQLPLFPERAFANMSIPDPTNTSPPLAHRQISPQPQGTTLFEPISELPGRSSVALPIEQLPLFPERAFAKQLITPTLPLSLSLESDKAAPSEDHMPASALRAPPSLPISSQMHIALEGFQHRWEIFAKKHRPFAPFQPGRSEENLKKEFRSLQTLRGQVYYIRPESKNKRSTLLYEIAPSLLSEDLLRLPPKGAFTYNNTTPYFDASTIFLGKRCYIACEGPRSKDIPAFFTMLSTQQVTHLVRLTPSIEGKQKKCHPYWAGLLNESSANSLLQVPVKPSGTTYPVQYYVEQTWKDNRDMDPAKLLSLVSLVKRDIEKDQSLLAVHCSLGIGRTGTFLVAIEILDALQNQYPFSIQELVFQISLQRLYAVSTEEQYLLLYRFAETILRH